MSSEVADGLGKQPEQEQGSVKAFGKRFIKEFQTDDLTGMAAQVAYHLIFAIPPLILLTVMVAALFNQYTHLSVVSTLQGFIDKRAPADLQSVLDSVINNAIGKVSGGTASIGVATTALVALWSGSNGISSFIKGFNRAYNVEEGRSFIKMKLLALGLTLALIFVMIVAFALFVFGRQIGLLIADQAGLGGQFVTVWNIGRWPVAIVFFMVLLSLLYYVGPNVDQGFKWASYGSVLATALWIAAVFAFKLYLTVSNPGSTYGAFGGIVVFLFFLYITSLIFLIGAELNAVLEWRHNGRAMAESPPIGPVYASPDSTSIQNGADPVSCDHRSMTPGPSNPHPSRQMAKSIMTGFAAAVVAAALGWLLGRNKPRTG